MASLLFIAPADLGETVLATGALAHAIGSLEASAVTIVCDPAAAELFRAAPNSTALACSRQAGAWLELAWRLGRKRFDLALDLNGRTRAFSLCARRRLARTPGRVQQHLVEELTLLMGAGHALAPKLWLDAAARAAAHAAVPGAGPLLALAPGGVTASKRWSPECFAATARRLLDGPLKGARLVLLGAAARDAEITRAIAASLDADGVAARDLGGGLDLCAAAALMEQATLCIGNDNALAHIAAAAGAPTLTLFGPTDERVRAPYGPRTRTLRGRPFEEITALAGLDERAAMEDVSVDAVEAAALDLLHAGGLR
jgi:lipopolysaccharide export system permease protein